MSSFDGIEAFARVVECGSFTAAAEKLQTAKSSVSDTVRALEERLGVRLLDRTTRSVRPTEAGLGFYARCQRLINDAEAARAEAQAAHGALGGVLRVAAPEGFAQRYIVPSLVGFVNAHPGVDIELVEQAGAVRLVDDAIDLAIRIAEAPDGNLVVRRIATSRVIVVAAPNYLAGFGVPTAPGDLLRHRCIGFSPLPWRDTWRLGEETVRIKPKLVTNNTESLRAAALAGLGLVALPGWMVNDAISSGALSQVLAAYSTPSAGIYAVYPSNRLLTPKVKAFVDHLAGELAARAIMP
jgi:DNA-binding transcriptional LysR family regulator